MRQVSAAVLKFGTGGRRDSFRKLFEFDRQTCKDKGGNIHDAMGRDRTQTVTQTHEHAQFSVDASHPATAHGWRIREMQSPITIRSPPHSAISSFPTCRCTSIAHGHSARRAHTLLVVRLHALTSPRGGTAPLTARRQQSSANSQPNTRSGSAHRMRRPRPSCESSSHRAPQPRPLH